MKTIDLIIALSIWSLLKFAGTIAYQKYTFWMWYKKNKSIAPPESQAVETNEDYTKDIKYKVQQLAQKYGMTEEDSNKFIQDMFSDNF